MPYIFTKQLIIKGMKAMAGDDFPIKTIRFTQ